ncbi:hypothetical protein BRD02_12715 [Halobacteriales archaeon QS_8_69_73]|nr:MAG: hypothetical protein BRD02_12715 [Halobacteriales archaeon QS_8_69_73]
MADGRVRPVRHRRKRRRRPPGVARSDLVDETAERHLPDRARRRRRAGVRRRRRRRRPRPRGRLDRLDGRRRRRRAGGARQGVAVRRAGGFRP